MMAEGLALTVLPGAVCGWQRGFWAATFVAEQICDD